MGTASCQRSLLYWSVLHVLYTQHTHTYMYIYIYLFMYIGKCILYIHWLFQSMLQSLLWYYHYPLCSQRFSEPTSDISQNMFCHYFLTVTLIPARIPFCRDRWQIQSPSCAVLVKQYVFHWCDMLCMSSILFFCCFRSHVTPNLVSIWLPYTGGYFGDNLRDHSARLRCENWSRT